MEKQSRGNCFEGLIYPKEYIRNYEIIREKYKPGKNKNTPYYVFCKHFLEKNAKYFWRMLHLQIGESCKASAGSYSASYIAIADHI